jgi:hypothetical protein
MTNSDDFEVDQIWRADIAPPADATELTPWVPWEDERYARSFSIYRADVALEAEQRVVVELQGMQYDDGSIERTLTVEHRSAGMPYCVEINGQQAREIAAALLAAADRIS